MGGTDITNDGCIGPKSTAFYELRAKGGAGAVTISECMVHPQTDAPTPTIWTPPFELPGLLHLHRRRHSPPRCHPQRGTEPLGMYAAPT